MTAKISAVWRKDDALVPKFTARSGANRVRLRLTALYSVMTLLRIVIPLYPFV
jgi:hypothetical protein